MGAVSVAIRTVEELAPGVGQRQTTDPCIEIKDGAGAVCQCLCVCAWYVCVRCVCVGSAACAGAGLASPSTGRGMKTIVLRLRA